jgi:hypothetical membrane protein
MTDGRAGGYAAIAGVATFVVATLALHVVQPGLSPRDEAVSYYVHGRFGWLLTTGLIALGLGSLTLALGLARTLGGRWGRVGRWLLVVWGVGVLLGGVCPADPAGHWSGPPSVSGMIHGGAAMVAFLALPLAALCLAIAFRQDGRWRAEAGGLLGLAVIAGISLVLFMASLVPVFVRPGPPILLGVSERVLLAVYATWLAFVGVGVVQRAPGRARRTSP